MMHITTLWAFQLVQMIEKSFAVDSLQLAGTITILAFIGIIGIWSIKTFQTYNKDVAAGLFENKNTETGMGKLSVILSLLSSSISPFYFSYNNGYINNYGQTNAKTASFPGTFCQIRSALSRLDVFRHAVLFFEKPVCWSFVALLNPESFNRLNSFVFKNSKSIYITP